MRSNYHCTRLALAALLGGVSALAGLCLDRERPLRGCALGLGLGASVGAIVAEVLNGGDRTPGLYTTGTRYYGDHQTESGF